MCARNSHSDRGTTNVHPLIDGHKSACRSDPTSRARDRCEQKILPLARSPPMPEVGCEIAGVPETTRNTSRRFSCATASAERRTNCQTNLKSTHVGVACPRVDRRLAMLEFPPCPASPSSRRRKPSGDGVLDEELHRRAIANRLSACRLSECSYGFIVADSVSKKTRSRIMSAIRKRGNKSTELRLATVLRQYRIIGWRRHCSLFGNPDFVFQKQKVAIFVDGCFWHVCRWHCRRPSSNSKYWSPKLTCNRTRDRVISAHLRKRGWLVLRFWEHELPNAAVVVGKVKRALQHRLEGEEDSGSR